MERSKLYGNNDLQLAQPYFLPTLLQTLSFSLYLIQVITLPDFCSSHAS